MSERTQRWPSIPLGKLAADMCLGKMLDKQKNRGTFRPYLRNVNVRWCSFDLTDMKEMRFEPGEEQRYSVRSGDLVVCEGGEPGRAAVWNGQAADARIQKALHRVRFRADHYDPYFAMYYLFFGTTTNRFAPYYTGTTIKHLTGKALAQVEFPLPPVNEQRRIVAKIEELFSDLDAGVAALERAKANLKRYRAAVLKAAVEGKLTEQWRAEHPDVEPADMLLQRILAGRRKKWETDQLANYEAKGKKPPKEWKEKYKEPTGPDTDNLPVLPDGWCWATVEQLIARSEYGTSVKCSYDAQGIPVLRIPNIAGGEIALADMKFATKEVPLTDDDALLCGDVLMCRTNGSIGLVGRTALVRRDFDLPHHFASYLLRFRLVERETVSAWLHTYSISHHGRLFIESHAASSAGQHNISLSVMHRMPVPFPPLSEQSAIVSLLEEKTSLIDASEREIGLGLSRASRLRQAILKRAFEGMLVPQDPSDEPASELLARIEAEHAAADSRGAKTNKQTQKRTAKTN